MAERIFVGLFFLFFGIVAFFGANDLDKWRSDFNVKYFKMSESEGTSEYMYMFVGIIAFIGGFCILVGLVSL